jgi:2,3-bisphosphoglycerate-independent phosphoglycerate mutase
LNHHPINEKRRAEGKAAANCLWFWGAGTKPSLTSFEEKTGKRGAMISAVDLLKGIAIGAKMKSIDVEGANGQLETNYAGKAGAALNVLLKDGYDFVYVHVEAPDEMGHQGSIERKIKAIEYLDKRLVKPVYEGLQDSGEKFRMLIMPDHPTPISLRTHTSDPVPYVLYDSTRERKTIQKYSEEEAELSGNMVNPGYLIMDRLLMLER